MMNLHPKMRTPNCQVLPGVTARQVGSSVTDTIQHRGSHCTVCAVKRKVGCDVCTNPEDGTQETGLQNYIYLYSYIYIYGYICTSVLASFPSCGDSLAGFGLRRASRNRLLGEMELTNTFKLREFCSLQYLRYKEMKHHKIGIE